MKLQMLHWLSDPIIIHIIWKFCQNKQVLATLLQDFLFFIILPPNQYKITKISKFRQTLHTKSRNSTFSFIPNAWAYVTTRPRLYYLNQKYTCPLVLLFMYICLLGLYSYRDFTVTGTWHNPQHHHPCFFHFYEIFR